MPTEIDHVQQTLLPPDVVEIKLLLGLANSGDHVQWSVSAISPTDGVLLAMETRPHAALSSLDTELTDACRRLVRLAREYAWTV